MRPVSKVGSIADRVQGISPFWYRFGAVFNAHVRAFSLCLSRLAGFEKDCFSRYAAPLHVLFSPGIRCNGRSFRR